MENFKQIKTFIVLSELQSFTKTAEVQNLSTMAISKQIKLLEQSIGEQLFIRSTRKVTLTEFGQLFYTQCKMLQQQWQEIDGLIQHHKIEPQGTLNVCVSHAFGKLLLMKHLKTFHRHYPKIELHITFSEEPNINEYTYDIFFGFPELPGITENLKYRKLYQTQNIICASSALMQTMGAPKGPEDLVNFPFINHSLRAPSNQIPLENGSYVLTTKPSIILNSFESLMTACIDGLGLFLTGDLLAHQHFQSGALVPVLPKLPYRKFQLYIFYRPTHYEQPKIRAFIDFYTRNE